MSLFGNYLQDQCVGRWSYSINGSITLLGVPLVPYEVFKTNNEEVFIRKSGSTGLEISFLGVSKLFRLNGHNLSADPDYDEDYSDDGITTNYSNYYSGQVISRSLIKITRRIEGSWRNRWGESGRAVGEAIITLKR